MTTPIGLYATLFIASYALYVLCDKLLPHMRHSTTLFPALLAGGGLFYFLLVAATNVGKSGDTTDKAQMITCLVVIVTAAMIYHMNTRIHDTALLEKSRKRRNVHH